MRFFVSVIVCFFSLLGFAQDSLTIREVFDFNIGDEFHRYTSPNGWSERSVNRSKVSEKVYSSDSTVLTYTMLYDNYYTDTPGEQNGYTRGNSSVSYTDLDSSIYWYARQRIAENALFRSDSNCRFDTTLWFSNRYCDIKWNQLNCFVGDFEPERHFYVYGEGVGVLSEKWYPGSSLTADLHIELFFYKKGDVSCGEPGVVSGLNMKKELSSNIEIYPNPTSKILMINVKNNRNPSFVKITQLDGRPIMKEKYLSEAIDTSFLNPGMYFLTLEYYEYTEQVRFVVK